MGEAAADNQATEGVITLSDAIRQVQQADSHNRVSKPAPGMRVESGPVSQGRYIPTVSLNPGVISAIENYEAHSGYVQCALNAFNDAHTGLQKLSDAREAARKNGAWTEANQVLIVAKEAERLQERMTRAMDSARQKLESGIKALEESLSAPIAAKADTDLSREVREYVSRMSQDKRHAFIEEAVKDRDASTLAAVLGAPHFLSGISRERQAHYTRQYHEQRTPEIAARVVVMRKALEHVETRGPLVFREIERCIGAKWTVIQQLRKTQSAAEQALLLVNQAPQP